MSDKNTPSIGLALSGGGARGAAHIGVIKALQENNIQPEVVAGTSAGSIVGALFAAGLSPEEMLSFIKESNILKVVQIGIPTGGFTKLTYLKERLAEVLPGDDFGLLSKPLYIAISNLNTGELEIVNEGQLYDVIVASCSIPLLFQPVEINGFSYVDGGLLCNLPAESLVPVADKIIGVNVIPSVRVANEKVNSAYDIAHRCFDMSILANTYLQTPLCNWLIEPKGVGNYNILAFHKYMEIYELGYEQTMRDMEQIKKNLELPPL